MIFEQYTLVIIKPDAMEQFLDPIAVDGLQKRGLSVVFRKFTLLSREHASKLYSEKREYNYYNKLIDFMTEGPSLLLLMKSNKSDGIASEQAKEYRDWARKNLKILKFEVKPEDLELLNKGKHPHQDEITREMALRNLIHVSDDTESALRIISSALTVWELNDLNVCSPEIYNFIRQCNEGSRMLSKELLR